VGDWLAERFTLFGATFQNWMTVALVIVMVGVLIAWWRQR
jgi:cell division protein FtsX